MPSPVNEINERLVIKLSGEAFSAGDQSVDAAALDLIGDGHLPAWRGRPRLAVVIWDRNVLRDRGATPSAIDRIYSDYVSMLSAVMNGIILQQRVQAKGLVSALLSVIPVGPVYNSYRPAEANVLLDSAFLAILAGDFGYQFTTAGTTASLPALKISAKTLIKVTRVDGIFEHGP